MSAGRRREGGREYEREGEKEYGFTGVCICEQVSFAYHRALLQGSFTGLFYRALLQGSFTGLFYRALLQGVCVFVCVAVLQGSLVYLPVCVCVCVYVCVCVALFCRALGYAYLCVRERECVCVCVCVCVCRCFAGLFWRAYLRVRVSDCV